MIYRRYYINLLIRIIFIILTCLLFAFAWTIVKDPIIDINLILLIGLQAYLLIRKMNKINDDLALFFDSIKYDDTGLKVFQKIKLKQYHQLYAKLDELSNHIANEKLKYAKQNHYLQTITEHTGAGLISINESGAILLCNKAAKNLFGLKSVTSIFDLNCLSDDFSEILINLQPGEQKLVKFFKKQDNRVMNLLLIATEFRSETTNEKLISISDIRNELDEKELDAWQKMIHILTHEMMNSIGPLTSTIATLKFIISEENRVKKSSELNDEMIVDIHSGLRIIDERTIGLQGFVRGFRSLTKLPQPEFAIVQVNDLFRSINELMSKDAEKYAISMRFNNPDRDATLYADKKLIEQVLINLIKNSMDALVGIDNPEIEMIFRTNETNQPQIVISDNGCGISVDQHDEIFVPFYTTKKDGSGIGLSLSRQIMRLHGGTLTFESTPNVRTSFCLKF